MGFGIQQQVDARLSAQPIKISDLKVPATYTPVRLLGFYTDEYFLLDNRTRHGRVGYEVLQVFETGSGGFLPGIYTGTGPQRGEESDVDGSMMQRVVWLKDKSGALVHTLGKLFRVQIEKDHDEYTVADSQQDQENQG